MSRDVLIRSRYRFTETEFNRFISALWTQIRQINLGRTQNAGSVTLTASVGSSVVSHSGFESTQTVLLTPLTANAAAEVGNGTMYVSARSDGSFTITHANNAQTDRDFEYVIVG